MVLSGIVKSQKQKKNYQEHKQGTPLPKANAAVAHFQTPERPWLSEVSSIIRRNAGSMWMDAHRAGLQGIRKPPKYKKKSGNRSALVTKELFEIKKEDKNIFLALKPSGAKPCFSMLRLPMPLGLATLPNQIWVSRVGAKYFLSFSYGIEEKELISPDILLNRFLLMPEEEQEKMTLGLDLGVTIPVMTSEGEAFDYSKEEKRRLAICYKRKQRYQRRMARMKGAYNPKKKNSQTKKTSELEKKLEPPLKEGPVLIEAKEKATTKEICKNREKLKAKLSKLGAKEKNIRRYFAHKISKKIAEKPIVCVVREDLNIKGMMAKPKPKPVFSKEGKILYYEKNRRAQKSALSKAISNVNWGGFNTCLEYKLKQRNKLLFEVAAHYSSQECSRCHYISEKNRTTQSNFTCIECHLSLNADHNEP
jgi:putative transposase